MNQSEKEYYYQEELRKLELERRAKELRDQDMAYETSALIDKSKEEEKKRQEKEYQLLIEQQISSEAQKLVEEDQAKLLKEKQLTELESQLPPEPPPSEPNVYHITLQFPNSFKLTRTFHQTNSLQQLKDFIDTRALHGIDIPAQYRIISNFPTQVWDDFGLIMKETTFQKRQLLRVEKL